MKIIGFVLLACILVFSPHAAKSEQLNGESFIRLDKLYRELTTCIVFVEALKTCARKSNLGAQPRINSWSDALLLYTFEIGKRIKMTKGWATNIANMELKKITKLMDANCTNITLAMDRYRDKCTQLGNDASKYLEGKQK